MKMKPSVEFTTGDLQYLKTLFIWILGFEKTNLQIRRGVGEVGPKINEYNSGMQRLGQYYLTVTWFWAGMESLAIWIRMLDNTIQTQTWSIKYLIILIR